MKIFERRIEESISYEDEKSFTEDCSKKKKIAKKINKWHDQMEKISSEEDLDMKLEKGIKRLEEEMTEERKELEKENQNGNLRLLVGGPRCFQGTNFFFESSILFHQSFHSVFLLLLFSFFIHFFL